MKILKDGLISPSFLFVSILLHYIIKKTFIIFSIFIYYIDIQITRGIKMINNIQSTNFPILTTKTPRRKTLCQPDTINFKGNKDLELVHQLLRTLSNQDIVNKLQGSKWQQPISNKLRNIFSKNVQVRTTEHPELGPILLRLTEPRSVRLNKIKPNSINAASVDIIIADVNCSEGSFFKSKPNGIFYNFAKSILYKK